MARTKGATDKKPRKKKTQSRTKEHNNSLTISRGKRKKTGMNSLTIARG